MAYSRHPRIQKTFQDRYNISISFALHMGRAIEGAIGSEFKVDALYLSADTQLALRLDDLIDTYDKSILLSGEFYKHLSAKGKTFCRKIDQVFTEDSRSPKVSSVYEDGMAHGSGQSLTRAVCPVLQEVYCFDMYPSDPLDDDQKVEDDVPNGKYIKHMDFEN